MALPYEKGVSPRSSLCDATPSRQAQTVLYYLQRAGHFYCDTHYSVERTFFNSFLLISVRSGRLEVCSQGETFVIGADQFGFINCYEPHKYCAIEPLEYYWIHLDGANAAAFCEEIRKEHGRVIQVERPKHIQSQMEQIFEQLHSVGRIEDVTASRRIHDLLCSLLYAADQNEAYDPLVAAAQQYLSEHLSEEISTPALAQRFHLSTSQFNRLFKLHTGQSPHEYLVNLRINHAKMLLKESRMSITEIAGAVGYEYDTSFAAAFRSKVGMSPRRFRNMPV
ncbi:MAG: helix-turn-helix domain-containing protein [Butyricicoccus sp.]